MLEPRSMPTSCEKMKYFKHEKVANERKVKDKDCNFYSKLLGSAIG